MMKPLPNVVVRLNGIPVDVDGISVGSDSPVDLHMPPRTGGIAGSDATVELAGRSGVTYRPEVPWSTLWRAKAGSVVEIDVDGVRVFTGVVDSVPASLRNPDLSLSCKDPLGDVETTFRAPALVSHFAGIPGATNRRGVGANTLWYVDHALRALGADSITPVVSRTVLHMPFTGSAHPVIGGEVERATRWDGDVDTGSILWPAHDIKFGPVGGAEVGRLGAINPYVVCWSRPYTAAPTGGHLLLVELNPDAPANTSYIVKTMTESTELGFGVRVEGNTVQVQTYFAGGGSVNRGALMTLEPGQTRILVRYSTTGTLEWRLRGRTTLNGSVNINLEQLNDIQVTRLMVFGRGTVPGASMVRSSYVAGFYPHPYLEAPYGVSYDLSTTVTDRRSILGHPQVTDEAAVPFVVDQASRDQAVVWTDAEGVIHWSDPRMWDNLPISHTISDGAVGGLDDVLVAVTRRPWYSRVRVLGKRVNFSWTKGPAWGPTVEWAFPEQQINLERGDDPVEMFLKMPENEFWVGEPDLNLRYAGEGPSEPEHHPDDFERGRWSWGGGYILEADGESTRWARGPDHPDGHDITVEAERLGYDTIKVTFTPGPDLLVNEKFINLASPNSPGLRDAAPHIFTKFLPRIRGWQKGSLSDIESVSDDIVDMNDHPDGLPEFVHDAGLAAGWPGSAQTMAQDLADRYIEHLGQVTVECDLNPAYRIGQRIHVKPTSRSDVTLDGVIIGIPNLVVEPGDARMTLRVWVMNVTAHSITWGEQEALAKAAGASTWGDHQANHNGTWAQERTAMQEAATTAANSLPGG